MLDRNKEKKVREGYWKGEGKGNNSLSYTWQVMLLKAFTKLKPTKDSFINPFILSNIIFKIIFSRKDTHTINFDSQYWLIF